VQCGLDADHIYENSANNSENLYMNTVPSANANSGHVYAGTSPVRGQISTRYHWNVLLCVHIAIWFLWCNELL